MLFFTVTNVRKKGSTLLKLALVAVLVAVLIPYVHGMMVEVNAMNELQTGLPAESGEVSAPEAGQGLAIIPPTEQQAAEPAQSATPEDADLAQEPLAATAEQDAQTGEGIAEEQYPGEPVRVDGELWLPLSYWQDIATILSY